MKKKIIGAAFLITFGILIVLTPFVLNWTIGGQINEFLRKIGMYEVWYYVARWIVVGIGSIMIITALHKIWNTIIDNFKAKKAKPDSGSIGVQQLLFSFLIPSLAKYDITYAEDFRNTLALFDCEVDIHGLGLTEAETTRLLEKRLWELEEDYGEDSLYDGSYTTTKTERQKVGVIDYYTRTGIHVHDESDAFFVDRNVTEKHDSYKKVHYIAYVRNANNPDVQRFIDIEKHEEAVLASLDKVDKRIDILSHEGKIDLTEPRKKDRSKVLDIFLVAIGFIAVVMAFIFGGTYIFKSEEEFIAEHASRSVFGTIGLISLIVIGVCIVVFIVETIFLDLDFLFEKKHHKEKSELDKKTLDIVEKALPVISRDPTCKKNIEKINKEIDYLIQC